jgi:hypothetical protein
MFREDFEGSPMKKEGQRRRKGQRNAVRGSNATSAAPPMDAGEDANGGHLRTSHRRESYNLFTDRLKAI